MPRPRALIEALTRITTDELADAATLRAAARAVPYAAMRAQLTLLAEREEDHARALAARLTALGGTPPPPQAPRAGEGWEGLLRALESEKADRVTHLEEAWSLACEETRALLGRLLAEEEENYRTLLDLIARLDPHALRRQA